MEPSVEISIIVKNNWNQTIRLLDSFLKNTKYLNYKVVIIDNASTDKTVNELNEYFPHEYSDRIKVIHNEDQLSFAACHNIVMSKTHADYICLLENTVELSENWLSKLVKRAESDLKIGIVAPIKKVGRQLLIGGKLQDDARCINIYDKGDIEWLLKGDEEIEWLHSCCLLIKTKLIRKIEVFDERFQNKYYEEVDFCIRAKEAGFKLVCDNEIKIEFYDDEPFELKQSQETNRVLFVEKNEKWLIKNKGKAVKRQRRPKRVR